MNRDTLWKEVEITHLRGSGPGGQNRNKRFSGIRIHHFPSGITVEATERRSQAQNLEMAWERLEHKLALRRRVVKRRVATRPSRASVAKRQTDKLRRSERKRQRRPSFDD